MLSILYLGTPYSGKKTTMQYVLIVLENQIKIAVDISYQDYGYQYQFTLPKLSKKISDFYKDKNIRKTSLEVSLCCPTKNSVTKIADFDVVIFVVNTESGYYKACLEYWLKIKKLIKQPLILQYHKRDLENIVDIEVLESLFNEKRQYPYVETSITEKISIWKCLEEGIIAGLGKTLGKN